MIACFRLSLKSRYKRNNMKVHQVLIFAFCVLALAACKTAESTDSPTVTLKNFVEASKTKNIETIKKLLSKSTMDLFEKTAAAQNTTVDKVLVNDNAAPLKEMPEIRNEKIEGDTATVEVGNKITGGYETIPFVKEDGVWKIALDKFIHNIIEKQKKAAVAPSSSAGNTQTSEPAKNNKQ